MKFVETEDGRLLTATNRGDGFLARMAIQSVASAKDLDNGAVISAARTMSPANTTYALLGIWQIGGRAAILKGEVLPMLSLQTTDAELEVAVEYANKVYAAILEDPA